MGKLTSFFRNLTAFCRDFDQISDALESDYARIHENHKLDPVAK